MGGVQHVSAGDEGRAPIHVDERVARRAGSAPGPSPRRGPRDRRPVLPSEAARMTGPTGAGAQPPPRAAGQKAGLALGGRSNGLALGGRSNTPTPGASRVSRRSGGAGTDCRRGPPSIPGSAEAWRGPVPGGEGLREVPAARSGGRGGGAAQFDKQPSRALGTSPYEGRIRESRRRSARRGHSSLRPRR